MHAWGDACMLDCLGVGRSCLAVMALLNVSVRPNMALRTVGLSMLDSEGASCLQAAFWATSAVITDGRDSLCGYTYSSTLPGL